MKCWKDSVQLTSVCQTFDMTGVTGVTGDMIGDMIGVLVSCRRLDISTVASACTHVSHFLLFIDAAMMSSSVYLPRQ